MKDIKDTKKNPWTEFRNTGLLWFINTILNVFGWAIFVEFDPDTGECSNGFPARTSFRGFSEEINDEGYIKISEYMNKMSKELLDETKS